MISVLALSLVIAGPTLLSIWWPKISSMVGIRTDVLSRQEAAEWLLRREVDVRFKH